MRPNWKGVISFGLVSIPIVLYPSKNRKADISFHQIDKRDNARIRYQRINANTGKVVPWEQIIKGYEYDKDQIIPVPEKLLKEVAGENNRTVDIQNFINKKDLDPVYIDNFYYIIPDKKGNKGYVLLREALEKTRKIGIAKVILTTKEHLAAVLPYGKALLLCLLKYSDELNKISEFPIPDKELRTYKISKKEILMAEKLVQSMSSAWKPEKYSDDYQTALHKWLEEAINHLPHENKKKKTRAVDATANFVDLLKKSLKGKLKEKKVPGGALKAHRHKILSKDRKMSRHVTRH